MAPGTRLNNRFVLLEPIGTGGMSQVWQARDDVLDRIVAVKVLAGRIATDPGLRDLTWREARATARLTHPHVAQVYDYGEAPLPDGVKVPYLVMELVRGLTLTDRLADGPVGWQEAARTGAQVAAALAAAHQVGVVHRDVKPANVVLTTAGAKVLDFGIAGLVGAVDGDRFSGTPTYTAPERLDGSPAHPSNDVYSLGVLLYEVLTGRPPASLMDWEQAIGAHRDGSLPRLPAVPDLPVEVRDLVAACLSPDPAGRPRARQVASALAAAAGMPDPTGTLPDLPTTVATQVPATGLPANEQAATGQPASPAAAGTGSAYAIGTAALPPPPTRVDGPPAAPHDRPPPRPSRLALAGIAVAVLVLALGAALLVAALQRPDQGGGDPAALPESAGERPATPSATSSDPASRAEALASLREAFEEGRLPALRDRAATELRKKLDEALRELEKESDDPQRDAKVREKLDGLLEKIDELEQQREIPPGVADRLRGEVQQALTLFIG